jgi:hypothetical protein
MFLLTNRMLYNDLEVLRFRREGIRHLHRWQERIFSTRLRESRFDSSSMGYGGTDQSIIRNAPLQACLGVQHEVAEYQKDVL